MFELTRAGALSAARAELMMAIKAMKMKRILELEELWLNFGSIICEMVLEG